MWNLSYYWLDFIPYESLAFYVNTFPLECLLLVKIRLHRLTILNYKIDQSFLYHVGSNASHLTQFFILFNFDYRTITLACKTHLIVMS